MCKMLHENVLKMVKALSVSLENSIHSKESYHPFPVGGLRWQPQERWPYSSLDRSTRGSVNPANWKMGWTVQWNEMMESQGGWMKKSKQTVHMVSLVMGSNFNSTRETSSLDKPELFPLKKSILRTRFTESKRVQFCDRLGEWIHDYECKF